MKFTKGHSDILKNQNGQDQRAKQQVRALPMLWHENHNSEISIATSELLSFITIILPLFSNLRNSLTLSNQAKNTTTIKTPLSKAVS